MRIVADENIPFADEVFGRLGDVRLMAGRKIGREHLADADALFVRSVTKVGPELLDGTAVRFVGTATIGTDHIDREYLADRRTGFSSAPGCNADSVAEYITAALLTVAEVRDINLAGSSIGIVGVGNVGSRVESKARALGMSVLLNDPPLARQTGDAKYRPLEELLDADFLTFHVPLTMSGSDATLHLCDAGILNRLHGECTVLNTSRGPVVDGDALKAQLTAGRLTAVLDVWENEPDIDVELLDEVVVATPHIAGYSFDGKVNGTMQVYRAACRFFGIEAEEVRPEMPRPEPDSLEIPAAVTMQEAVADAVTQAYPIMRDDRRLRRIADIPCSERGAFFDNLRKTYPVRREFHSRRVSGPEEQKEVVRTLVALGFKMCEHNRNA